MRKVKVAPGIEIKWQDQQKGANYTYLKKRGVLLNR